MPPTPEPSVPASRLQQGALTAILALVLAAALDGLRYALFNSKVGGNGALIVPAALSALVCLAAAARHVRDWRKGVPGRCSSGRIRLLFYAICLALAIQFAFLQPYLSPKLHIAAGLGAGIFAGGLLLGTAVPPRMIRGLDVVLMNLCLLAIGAEGALRLLAQFRPSPILSQPDTTAADMIRRRRLPPGSVRFGFPVNSEGHYDTEFTPKGVGTLVVSVGDSFSAGVVPHEHHFTTVCERERPGCAVYNMGMIGTGPREYLHLIRHRALPLKPDLIVVNLYIGNDLVLPQRSSARFWFDRENFLLAQVPVRLLKRRGVQGDPEAQPAATVAAGDGPAKFPWVDDPSLETPRFSPEAFVGVESSFAAGVLNKDAAEFEPVLKLVDEMHGLARPVPFAVMLIPAEFQVEDDTWRDVAARLERPGLDRDSPQRVLGRALADRGIPCLDLLPELRAAAPLADGRRHCYHLRDTHFNARGNRIAGAALAKFVASILK